STQHTSRSSPRPAVALSPGGKVCYKPTEQITPVRVARRSRYWFVLSRIGGRMGWLVTIGDLWLNTLAWLTGFAVAFGILARLMPCNPGMYWWKNLRAAGVDFLYWFVVPLFLRIGYNLLLIAGLLLLFGGDDPEFLPVKRLPLWQQGVAILLLQDL